MVEPLNTKALETVAWMHPTAGWAREKYHSILPHCQKTGPGPVALVRKDAAESRAQSLEDEVKVLREAVERSNTALNDWLNVYAGEFCNPDSVAEAQARIGEVGTIAYIASVTAQNRAALKENGNG